MREMIAGSGVARVDLAMGSVDEWARCTPFFLE